MGGVKGKDSDCAPVCVPCHDRIETGGQETYERRYGVDLKAEAARLARLFAEGLV
jgi:hypothetical protein